MRTVAWLLVLPVAALTVLAIVALGPWLGGLLFDSTQVTLWPEMPGRPEPAEHVRYLFAIAAPIVLSALLLVRTGSWPPSWFEGPAARAAVVATQLLLVGAAAVAVVAQQRLTYSPIYSGRPIQQQYFTVATIVFALVAATALSGALYAQRPFALLAALFRETRAKRIACAVAAVAFVVVWLLTAISLDSSVGNTNGSLAYNLPFWMDETYAVLNGRTPLVDFLPQYSQLWPYVGAVALRVFGDSVTVYTTIFAAITGLSFLGVFALLRRVTRSSVAGLALFLAFVSTSFFKESGPWDDRYAPSNLFSLFPMRYAGPLLLVWLVSRYLDDARPRRPIWIFVVAGFVAINNPEFGIAALGATVAAVIWAAPGAVRTRAGALRLAGEVAGGVAAALIVVSLLTLVRSGSLPDFANEFEFSRIFGLAGFGMLPMPTLGVHLLLYGTFAAAIVLATVRAVGHEEDTLMTGLLVWSGIFGLGTGSYFAGRSHPEVLISVFSIWALTVALLAVCAARGIAARRSRRPSVAEWLVLVLLGITVASIAQTPAPGPQIERLGDRTAIPLFAYDAEQRFVAERTRPGEKVVILLGMGHRIARDTGVQNVSPYADPGSILSEQQLRRTIDRLRESGGTKMFLSTEHNLVPTLYYTLADAGFHVPGDPRRISGLIVMEDQTSGVAR